MLFHCSGVLGTLDLCVKGIEKSIGMLYSLYTHSHTHSLELSFCVFVQIHTERPSCSSNSHSLRQLLDLLWLFCFLWLDQFILCVCVCTNVWSGWEDCLVTTTHSKPPFGMTKWQTGQECRITQTADWRAGREVTSENLVSAYLKQDFCVKYKKVKMCSMTMFFC